MGIRIAASVIWPMRTIFYISSEVTVAFPIQGLTSISSSPFWVITLPSMSSGHYMISMSTLRAVRGKNTNTNTIQDTVLP